MCALCKGNKTEGWERCCQLKLTKRKQNVFPDIQLLFSVFWDAPGTVSSSSTIYLNVFQLWAAPDSPSWNFVRQQEIQTWRFPQCENMKQHSEPAPCLVGRTWQPSTCSWDTPVFHCLLWFLLQGHKSPVFSHLFPFSHHNLFLGLYSV